ncbi:MAG: sugar ABC transporter ATP-binding protein [Clostridia bacterium]|nr:sugar ABC transporter ATP-binding protein [Clostridia bacterium]
MQKKCILKIQGVNKTFVTTQAVKNLSLELYSGEIRGLIGENGSGKSTISSIVAGILNKDSGRIEKNGKEYNPRNYIDANAAGVSMIVQEMGTVEGLTVAENLFLGRENTFVKGVFLNVSNMNKSAQKLLDTFGIKNIKATALIKHISFEDRKLVELVRALYMEPDILIVDETTTALSQNGRDMLFNAMEDMKKKGRSVIFITHDLQEMISHSDTITVMKDGEVVDTVNAKDIDESKIKSMMVGRELSDAYYRTDFDPDYSDEVVLQVNELELNPFFRDINIELHAGEILGIGGLTNCGMHELGKAIFGALKAKKGTVTIENKKTVITDQRKAIANGIGYVSKNRDQEGLMLSASIRDNICLPSYDILAKGIHISPKSEISLAGKGSERLNIKMNSVEQAVMDLSGGNKQKVVLSKWLSKGSKILILDCPTRGIDVSVKAAVYALMQDLKKENSAVLMISEELQELIGMCDRLIVLKHGEIANTFTRNSELDEETVIQYML